MGLKFEKIKAKGIPVTVKIRPIMGLKSVTNIN